MNGRSQTTNWTRRRGTGVHNKYTKEMRWSYAPLTFCLVFDDGDLDSIGKMAQGVCTKQKRTSWNATNVKKGTNLGNVTNFTNVTNITNATNVRTVTISG